MSRDGVPELIAQAVERGLEVVVGKWFHLAAGAADCVMMMLAVRK